MSYADLPEPPSESRIRVERDRSGLVLSWEDPYEIPKWMKGCLVAFVLVWIAGVWAFIGSSIAMALFFCSFFICRALGWMEALQGHLLVLFAGFFVLWFGIPMFFLVIRRRKRAVVSGKVPHLGWRIVLQPAEWSVTRCRSGKTLTTRIDPHQITHLTVDAEGCVVAQLTGRRVVLTTPMELGPIMRV